VKVLITGAGGNLGRTAIPLLAEHGHDVLALDARPLELEHETVQADVGDRAALERAVEGVDAVVHAAALHGVHLREREPADFWATNVTGTFNVYESARAAGVRKVVLASTMGVYGRTEAAEGWAVVTEESDALATDVYGLSKWLCEQLARYHARTGGPATVALRLGMFVPETFERYGFRLLFGGVDDRDVAQAVRLALEHEPEGRFDYFNVMAATPFDEVDARALGDDPAGVIDRHWPGTTELVAERGLRLDELLWGEAVFPIEKAARVLGYRPLYGFDEFLAAWQRGDESHYPFAGLSQWGV